MNKISQEAFEEKHGHFSIQEYCITGDLPPEHIAESILCKHIETMNPIREELGVAISVSKNSGYRPKKYEIKKGRSGNSQHTFEDSEGNPTDGAADYTSSKLIKLLQLLQAKSTYTRICYYPKMGFIHCDFKPTADGKRQYFENSANGWKFIRNLK